LNFRNVNFLVNNLELKCFSTVDNDVLLKSKLMKGNTVKISSCPRSRKLQNSLGIIKSLSGLRWDGKATKVQQAGRPISFGHHFVAFGWKKRRKTDHLSGILSFATIN